jgi:hypothetical protein
MTNIFQKGEKVSLERPQPGWQGMSYDIPHNAIYTVRAVNTQLSWIALEENKHVYDGWYKASHFVSASKKKI